MITDLTTDHKGLTTENPDARGVLITAFVVVALLLAAVPYAPSAQARSYPEDQPIIYEEKGVDEAWAFAITRKMDDPGIGRPDGNNGFHFRVDSLGEIRASAKGVGIVRLHASDPVNRWTSGSVGAIPDDRDLFTAGNMWLDRGETGYFLAWAAGTTEAKITIRANEDGFQVEEVVKGQSYAIGTEDLIDESIRIQESVEPGPLGGEVGVDASVAAAEGLVLDAENPLYGYYSVYYRSGRKMVCTGPTDGPVADCPLMIDYDPPESIAQNMCGLFRLVTDEGVLLPVDCRGPRAIGVEFPDGTNTADLHWDNVWIMPGGWNDIPAPTAGTYRFNVDRWASVCGNHQDETTDVEVHCEEARVHGTIAEIDLTPLAAVSVT